MGFFLRLYQTFSPVVVSKKINLI